jgi:hypothetical protein
MTTARDVAWEGFIRRAADVIRRRNTNPAAATFLASVIIHDGATTCEIMDFNAGQREHATILAYLADKLVREAGSPEIRGKAERVKKAIARQFGMEIRAGSAGGTHDP